MSRAGVVSGLLRAVVRVDRSALEARAGARCALGVALPLAVGVGTGHAADGLAAAVGALSAGFASFQGAYRTRAAAMVIASVGMAISTFAGAVTDHSLVLAVATVALWGFATGLLVAIGPAAMVVGLQIMVAFIVVREFPMSTAQAFDRACLVLVGGAVQTLLVVVFWPLRRFRIERAALAQVYRTLGRYAAHVADGTVVLPAAGPLINARTAMSDPQPLARRHQVEAFQGLLDEAERIRIELAGLARDRERLLVAPGAEAVPALDAMLSAAASALDTVAESLSSARLPSSTRGPRQASTQAVSDLDRLRRKLDAMGDVASDGSGRVLNETVTACEALLGQLRTAIWLASTAADSSFGGSDEDARGAGRIGREPRRSVLPLRRPLLTLRANLSFESTAFRHAVRLGVMLGVATALARLANLPHGYWVGLTVLVVLKPDFTATFSRGLARLGGTVVGAGLATLYVAGLRPGPPQLIAGIVVVAFCAYTLLRVNYAVFAVCMTAVIAMLLAIVGLPELTAVRDRIADTALGGALALAAYAAWPTWERAEVPQRLAELLATQNAYVQAVLGAYVDPAAHNAEALRGALVTARLARSNAEASLDRWMAEPARHREASGAALGVLAAAQRNAGAALALHAHLPHAARRSRPALAALAHQLDQASTALARAVRTGGPPAALPPLRATHLAMVEAGAARARATAPAGSGEVAARGAAIPDSDPPAERRDAALLISETDLIVDGVNTIGHLLGARHASPPG